MLERVCVRRCFGIRRATAAAGNGPPAHLPKLIQPTKIMRIVRYSSPNHRSAALRGNGSPRFPWAGLETEIDRWFETALTHVAGSPGVSTRFPVDLYEDKDRAYVRAELPGVNREEINVEVVDDHLTITAARKTPATDDQPEQSFSFSRSVHIPDEVQTDGVTAAYENGVLTVTLPKREEAKPQKISVAVK
jgi:HSP20 family protein